jgi:glutathione S-transferase
VWGAGVGLAAACHFVASLPDYPHSRNIVQPPLIEYDVGDNALRDTIFKEPIAVENGACVLPNRPGLGVELDPLAVRRFSRPRSCGATPWEKKFAPLSGTRRWRRRGFQGKAPMGLKLHYNPLSTFSRRVLIAFAEKQVPHELVVVDMAARRHREQPYLSLNPYGRVPTLDEDGFVLFESTAILNYLEATRPSPPLVPADTRGRALVDMHMKLCDLQLTRYAGTIIFPKRFLPKERWNVTAIAEAKAEIEKHLAILDKQLAGKTYLVAEQFSLAEVCYMPFLDFLPLMEITPPSAVAGWSERLLARGSAVTTRPER